MILDSETQRRLLPPKLLERHADRRGKTRSRRRIACAGFVAVCGLISLSTLATARAGPDIWIDTDPSLGLTFHDADDGFALIQAFHSPEVRIRGISVSYGNTTLGKALPIARKLAERFGGPAEIDAGSVVSGAVGPEDLGRETDATRSLEKLLETCSGDQRRLVYVALGPLTDLATSLQRRPDLVPVLESAILLGGRSPGEHFRVAGSWNRYEFHDANFEKDPAATAIVLRSGVPVILVPVGLAFREELLITSGDFDRLRNEGDEAGRYLAEAASSWLRGWRYGFGARGGPLFDSLAILAVTHPQLCTFSSRRVVISPRIDAPVSESSQGNYLLIMPEDSATPAASSVKVCASVAAGAKATIMDRLLRRPPATQ